MAKKSAGQELISFDYCDNIVYKLYNSGIIQSTIIHTCILLFMALVFISEPKIKHIVLELSFSSSETEDIKDAEEFPSIEILEQQYSQELPATNTTIEKTNIVDDRENLSVEMADFVDDIPVKSELETLLGVDLQILNTQVLADPSQEIKKPAPRSPQIANRVTRQTSERSDTDQEKGGGRLSDIKKRLSRANAGTGDLQISIAWDSTDDVDLHVNYISSKMHTNSYICWISKLGLDRGYLDVDRNAFPTSLTDKPVENIFWPDKSNPQGQIAVGLHLFKNWSGKMRVPVILIINNKGVVTTHSAIVVYGDQPKEVLRFKVN